MPTDFMSLDASFPSFLDGEKTDAKLKRIQNYLFMLLEQLRYTLEHLSLKNFNAAAVEEMKDIFASTVTATTVISQTLITNELYSSYGAIADLTVDRLRTDWTKAQKYLNSDTSDVDYISIHDETIDFISASTAGNAYVQLTDHGRSFYWKDETHTQMTSEDVTRYPVLIYVYTEQVKGSFRFFETVGTAGNRIKAPRLTLGAGTGTADNDKLVISKPQGSAELRYMTPKGQEAGVYFRPDGFVDFSSRRASIRVNTTAQTITVSPEGEAQSDIIIGYRESGGKLTLTWPDNEVFTVEVTG